MLRTPTENALLELVLERLVRDTREERPVQVPLFIDDVPPLPYNEDTETREEEPSRGVAILNINGDNENG
jgi:hypothetical protein